VTGRTDIANEASQLSSYLATPRRGHVLRALHVMSCLKMNYDSRLALDPSYPEIDVSELEMDRDWV
jgi:hypothetical protein